MKTTRIATFAIVAALACAAAACPSVFAAAQDTSTPAPTPSKITAATVYTDRAIVTRAARAELPAGESLIVLEKLPADLIDESVQVGGRGTAAATILDVTAKITHTDNSADANQPRVKALQDEIKAVDETLRALQDRDRILQQQTNLVEKIENAIAAPPGKETASQPKIEDMQKLMTFSAENRAQLALDRQKLSNEITETNNKHNALQLQLNEILAGANVRKSYKTVTVRVSAAKAGSLDMNIAYTVPGARWTPAYDARLRAETREVELSYFGIVRQSSGEDWNNISLTLSTARPGLGGAAPKGKAWFVDVFVPKPPEEPKYKTGTATIHLDGVNNYTGATMINGGAMLGNRAQYVEGYLDNRDGSARGSNGLWAVSSVTGTLALLDKTADYAVASVSNATTSASFKIAAATTIPSDNTPQKVSITTAKLTAKLEYQAMPAMQETAYLSAYVTNSTDFPLLAGNANIFLDDAFVSTSTLKTVMPSEKFQLALGADEGVSIKRRVVNRFTENTGLTGSGRRVTYEYLVTITNNKKSQERVVFTEMLPISKNEKITVNLLAPAAKEVGTREKPGKEVTREEDNALFWRIDMKPGEKREIPVKFNIEYPGDIQVSGLE